MEGQKIELTDYKTNKIHKIDKDDVMTFSRITPARTQVFVLEGINSDLRILEVKESWGEIFNKVFK